MTLSPCARTQFERGQKNFDPLRGFVTARRGGAARVLLVSAVTFAGFVWVGWVLSVSRTVGDVTVVVGFFVVVFCVAVDVLLVVHWFGRVRARARAGRYEPRHAVHGGAR